MNNRYLYLDALRGLAVLLVAYGHLVSVGTFSPSLPNIIPIGADLPLLDFNQHSLWKIENLFINFIGSQSALIGVLLFFIITGFLMPKMFVKYNRYEFLLNRILRIFPPLIVAVALCWFISFIAGYTFNFSSYLSSVTLTYPLLFIVPIVGVLWTLCVEMLFYIILFLINGMSRKKLILLSIFSLLATILPIAIKDKVDSQYLIVISYNFRFINTILVGVALHFLEKSRSRKDFILLLFISLFHFVGLYSFESAFQYQETYYKLGPLLFVIFIFISFYFINIKGWFTDKVMKYTLLSFYAKNCYSFYLIHIHVGLFTIYYMRNFISNNYVLIFLAFLMSSFAAAALRIIIEDRSIHMARKAGDYLNIFKRKVNLYL